MKKREAMLANDSIGRLIIRLSLPAVVGMFVNGLYNLVDTIYIGHSVGALGIAGLSVSFPLQMLIGGTGAMLGIGSASIISRSLGAKNYKRAERTLGNNIFSVMFLGVAFAVLGKLFLDDILKLFGATANILPYAKDYMAVIFLGSPLILFAMSMNNIIRSEGAARTAMASMLIGALTNIVLDPIFIFILDMGVRGAAIATVLSRVLVAGWISHFFYSGKSIIKPKLNQIHPDSGIIKEILSVGFPSLLQHASSSFVFGLINNLAGIYGGDLAITIFGISNRVIIFSSMSVIGIAQGMQPIVGYNYGARKYYRAAKAVRLSNLIAMGICGAVTVLLLLFPKAALHLFTSDTNVLEKGPAALRIMVSGFFLMGYNKIGGVFFQALGKARPAFIINLARPILFFVPLLMILPRIFGLNGIWLAFPLADVLSYLLTMAFLLPYERRLKNQYIQTQGDTP
ncbi:MATE efflux family protein [Thermovirga lienii DSM 17291]|uniref:Multidrug export protein MepA n=1 Tax=Thermovirga lienii (strain ATCC BAA-1197 / DSM 17291 / Cas60314) TaxID=580340 RepID=G7V8I0_THELD|nr:MATE family efflux transporter [Thermovirga lienii]AER67441.1 MATE efflux family protein [Thermovirga lienii DSM 17291]